VIAAFDEARVIGDTVAAVVAAGFRLVVIDDGSRDDTAAIAPAGGAEVVRHPINLGQGAALQTGFDWALSRGAEVIVTFDGDGQHRITDVPRLVAALAANDADYALGSRFLGGSRGMPASRRAMLKAAVVFSRMTTGLDITDAHNGLRAMTRRGAQHVRLRENRMAHASEILHQISASGLSYVEVPVTIDYTAYSLAKGQRIADVVAILLDLLARRLQR
jgi:glycosyltransferase involved in cell wall biosynthesis